MTLYPVPKKLGVMKSDWNPTTLACSFKLETDEDILEKKALGAIAQYEMDCVVANLLQTRRTEVIFYEKNAGKRRVHLQDDGEELESLIVKEVKRVFEGRFGPIS